MRGKEKRVENIRVVYVATEKNERILGFVLA